MYLIECCIVFVSVNVEGSEPVESSQDLPPEVPSAVDSTQWVAPPSSGYSTARYLLQNQGASSSDDPGIGIMFVKYIVLGFQ